MTTQTERLAKEILAGAKRRLPTLRAAPGRSRRSIKCIVVPATLDDEAVVLKAVVSKAPVWSWYLRRERLLYERFLEEPPPLGSSIRVPRVFAKACSDNVLVLERIDGEPLAAKRHDRQQLRPSLDAATWSALLELQRALRRWSRGIGLTPTEEPDAASTSLMRRRLLEDPCAPLAWMTDGIARAARRNVVTNAAARTMTRALEDHPATCFGHGDLLLRNILRDDAEGHDGALTLIDWECAGRYLEGWDAALLWIWSPPRIRKALREEREHEGEAPLRAFLACVAFALVREIVFRGKKPDDVVRTRLEHELLDLTRELEA